MKLYHLKGIRLYVSLIFFLLVSILYLDFYNLVPESFTGYILYFQFIPSLFKFIDITTISVAGFIIILLLTFLYGRVYCSSICPLGTLQDFILRISKKIANKKSYGNLKDYKWIKSLFLAVV